MILLMRHLRIVRFIETSGAVVARVCVHEAVLLMFSSGFHFYSHTFSFAFNFMYLSSELDLQMCTDNSYLCICT